MADLYSELASNFHVLARVLGVAAMCEEIFSASELLKIYERWLSSGDEKLKDILSKHGLTMDNIEENE